MSGDQKGDSFSKVVELLPDINTLMIYQIDISAPA